MILISSPEVPLLKKKVAARLKRTTIMIKTKSAFLKILISLVCMPLIISQTGCSSNEPVSDTGFYLDTSCEVSIYGESNSRSEELIAGVFSLCEHYENLLSKTVKGSDVSKINAAAGAPVKVHDSTLEVIESGIEFGRISDKFDITVGALTDLWDFESADPKVPPAAELDAAAASVDYKQIEIDGNRVRLANPDARIDLGGIAKGYIADRTYDYLNDENVERAIINLGGNIVTIGEKAEDTPWSIGIERPYSDRSEIIGSIEVSNRAVVTSGVYERKFRKGGRLYHHILDPRTGYPVTGDLEAVTVVGRVGSSMQCDALSTICLMLGKTEATALIESLDGYEALFVDGDDNVTETRGVKFAHSD